MVSARANCGHARGASCARKSEAAGYLLLGPSLNRGLGRTRPDRYRGKRLQHGSRVPSTEQLPDRCGGDAVDYHRSGPVGNHAAFARGILTSRMTRIIWFTSDKMYNVVGQPVIESVHGACNAAPASLPLPKAGSRSGYVHRSGSSVHPTPRNLRRTG